MHSSSLVPALFRALVCPCLLLVGLSCKSSPTEETPAAPPQETASAETEVKAEAPPTAPVPEAKGEAASAVSSVAPAQVPPPTLPTAVRESPEVAVAPAAASGEAGKIPAATKRTAAGLPDPLPGCVSWLRLKANPASPTAHLPHYAARQPYILLPERDKYSSGEKLSPPLPEGTTVALEEKMPQDDFIRRLSVMTREKQGWKFLEYSRNSSQEAFAPAEAGACSECHAKAQATDSVYSLLILE